jgi:glycosyltransferase involved in cell wall biosynthesis
MKHVVLETSAAVLNKAGTGRVTTGLSQALQTASSPGWRIHTIALEDRFGAMTSQVRRRLFVLFWEWVYVPHVLPWRLRQLRPDILHCLFPIPLTNRIRNSGCTLVTTIHDIFPVTHPDWFGRLAGTRLRRWLRLAVAHSDRFIAVSEYTARGLEEHFGVGHDRIQVAHPGGGLPADSTWAAPEPLILAVGSLEPRKNLTALFRAYAQLKSSGLTMPRLFVAGGSDWRGGNAAELLNRLGLRDDVVFLGFVTDERLAALYQQARMLVFPSLAEGFGLPAVEAMAAGCPVIAANAGALPEVVGDAGLLVDPTDTSTIAAAMQRVLADKDLARRLADLGREKATQLSWATCAQKVMSVYEMSIGK